MQYSAGFFIVFEALSREHTQRVCDRGSNEEDDKKDKLDCIGYFVPGPYVVIDLKLDKLTHQDLGQMQMYVNHYDRNVKLPAENPTIGILLCRQKKDAIVKLTLPKDANIHAKEYQLFLPSKGLLKAKM